MSLIRMCLHVCCCDDVSEEDDNDNNRISNSTSTSNVIESADHSVLSSRSRSASCFPTTTTTPRRRMSRGGSSGLCSDSLQPQPQQQSCQIITSAQECHDHNNDTEEEEEGRRGGEEGGGDLEDNPLESRGNDSAVVISHGAPVRSSPFSSSSSSTSFQQFFRHFRDQWGYKYESVGSVQQPTSIATTTTPSQAVSKNVLSSRGSILSSSSSIMAGPTQTHPPPQLQQHNSSNSSSNTTSLYAYPYYPLRPASSFDASYDIPMIGKDEVVLPGSALQHTMALWQRQSIRQHSSNSPQTPPLLYCPEHYCDENDFDADTAECVMCLERFDASNPRIPTHCGCGKDKTYFHLPCLYQWIEHCPECPSCRQVLTWEEFE